MTNVTFEEKIAYEIGVKLAHEAYMEKEASWRAVKNLGLGLKSVATGGQGATSVSQAFRQGTKGQQTFKGVMAEIGDGLKKPWQDMYRTYGARQGVKAINTNNAAVTKARNAVDAARKTNDPTKIQAAQRALADTQGTVSLQNRNIATNAGGVKNMLTNAKKGYIPRDQFTGAVDYGQLGTMAAGVGLAGTGAYMAGNAAFGGGAPQPQPQVAPHQYYLNQLSSYFGG